MYNYWSNLTLVVLKQWKTNICINYETFHGWNISKTIDQDVWKNDLHFQDLKKDYSKNKSFYAVILLILALWFLATGKLVLIVKKINDKESDNCSNIRKKFENKIYSDHSRQFFQSAPDDSDWMTTAKLFYGLGILMNYVKLLHTFSVVEALGPKVLMLTEMIKDTLSFLLIIFITCCGFGVGAEFLLLQDSYGKVSQEKTIKKAFDHTYWPMLGDIGGMLEVNWFSYNQLT